MSMGSGPHWHGPARIRRDHSHAYLGLHQHDQCDECGALDGFYEQVQPDGRLVCEFCYDSAASSTATTSEPEP